MLLKESVVNIEMRIPCMKKGTKAPNASESKKAHAIGEFVVVA